MRSGAIWRIYEMLLATTLEFTLPLGDRCSHSLCVFITQTHNNVQPLPPASIMLNHEQHLWVPEQIINS